MRSTASYLVAALLLSLQFAHSQEVATVGAETTTFYGYDDCIRLSNESVEVILCPAAGGRVLRYALKGKNILYLPPGNEGWVWDGGNEKASMDAGRFDIGPEQIVPRRNKLWKGRWKGEITGEREAQLKSPVDEGPGVSLVRAFKLAAQGSKLECKQTIVSASDTPVEYCHWSRTFATGKGICIVPLTKPGRFSEGYVRYESGKLLNMKPTDEHVKRVGDYLIVSDHPKNPKLGFDSMEGWLAYHSTDDLLFVKKFPTYPQRAYNEVAGLTISIWYPDRDMVELEPIGPRERLEKRGDSASFTETWFLVDHKYPNDDQVSPDKVAKQVQLLK